MSRQFPCPNPNCPHTFSADAVAGLKALVCPACGGVFQRHVEPHTIPTGPGATPLHSPRFAEGWLLHWLSVASVLFGLGCLGFALWFILGRKPVVERAEPFQSPQYNYSFLVPGPPWRQMSDLRIPGIVVALNFRRNQPDARFVVAVRDFKEGYPFDSELSAETSHLLIQGLGLAHLALDPRDDSDIANEPASRQIFQAEFEGVPVSGDVQVVRRRGFIYWMVRQAAAKDVTQAQAELDSLRDRFGWLDQRPDWQPTRQRFADSASGIALTGIGGRWTEAPFPPKQYDPWAVLMLEARLMGSTSRDLLNRATMKALIAPEGKGPLIDRARDHLLARQIDEFPGTKLIDLPQPDEQPEGSGPLQSATIRSWTAIHGENREMFIWLAATTRGSRSVVLQGECIPERRAVWEPEFRRLAATLEIPE